MNEWKANKRFLTGIIGSATWRTIVYTTQALYIFTRCQYMMHATCSDFDDDDAQWCFGYIVVNDSLLAGFCLIISTTKAGF